MSNAELLRKLRADAVAAGLCQECRCRPARVGFKSCQVCCDRRRNRDAERKAAGLCPCGRKPDGEHSSCLVCRQRDLKHWRESRRPQLIEAGRCLMCVSPAAPGRTLCERHLEMQAARARRRRARRIAEGLCSVDGCKRRPNDDHVLCVKHRVESRERYYASRRSA